MTGTAHPQAIQRPLTRAMTVLLLILGAVMSVAAFAVVLSMPDMMWHPARDAELRATYETYHDTGTLLIKETGSGSYGVQAPAPGPLTFATWDDDPGSYIIASIAGDLTGSDSPYPGLRAAQALLVALPLIWLPLAVARVVGRARAGFAVILLPLVVWMFNHGAVLVGTEYGLSDPVSSLPVYSLYGTAASLAFLSLTLIVLLSTYRLRIVGLIGATVGIGILAAAGNLSRSLSGIGVAVAVGVLWWIWARGKWRWLAAAGGALIAVVLAVGIQTATMNVINVQRVETTGQSLAEVPDAHTAWHSLYLGLSYPQPLTGEPSRFDVTWADEYGWAKAREIDPDVLVASERYDEILKELYWHEVTADPLGAVILYAQKALYLLKHFGGMVLFIAAGFAVGLARRGALQRSLLRVLIIATPLLLLGLVPAIMVMPMLYYYSELAAVLGLLSAVSLGVLAWAILSWPSRIRADRRRREGVEIPPTSQDVGLGVILVPAPDAGSIAVDDLARQVELEGVEIRPRAAGTSLRDAVLESSAPRLLIATNAAAITPAALRIARDSHDVLVAIGTAEPSRGGRTRLRRVILGTGDLSPGALAVDGDWARRFAVMSQAPDDLWIDELAYAAQQQNILAVNAAGPVDSAHAVSSPGFWRSLVGFVRISLRKDEYATAALAP